MRELTNLFKALSDESRLRILNLIANAGELCVCDIEHTLGFTQTKVSRHLTYLKHAGLVNDRRAGLWVLYSLSDTSQKQHIRLMKELKDILNLHPILQEDIKRLKKAIKKGNCTTVSVILPSISSPADLPRRKLAKVTSK
ncbi:MAG: ArsR family transcriptional regulator [Bacteroidetes bacterium]|nr:MAG: ArsR family transcriptional regulator [Bacteroidota bacterium]